MNQEFLDSLVGLTIKEAESKIYELGHEVDIYEEGTMTLSITRPDDLVEIYHNKSGIVVHASNQQVTDTKYAKKMKFLGFEGPDKDGDILT